MEKEINHAKNRTRIKNKIAQLQKETMQRLELMLPGKDKAMLQEIAHSLQRMALLFDHRASTAANASEVHSVWANNSRTPCRDDDEEPKAKKTKKR